jgi:hypothetical protein
MQLGITAIARRHRVSKSAAVAVEPTTATLLAVATGRHGEPISG